MSKCDLTSVLEPELMFYNVIIMTLLVKLYRKLPNKMKSHQQTKQNKKITTKTISSTEAFIILKIWKTTCLQKNLINTTKKQCNKEKISIC